MLAASRASLAVSACSVERDFLVGMYCRVLIEGVKRVQQAIKASQLANMSMNGRAKRAS